MRLQKLSSVLQNKFVCLVYETNLHIKTLCAAQYVARASLRCSADKLVASKPAMKGKHDTGVLRTLVKIRLSSAVVIQWSPQVDLASHVCGDTQVSSALHSESSVTEAKSVR